MANLRTNWKKKKCGFGNIEERRIIRAVAEGESRRNKRSAVFALNRGIAGEPSTSSASSTSRLVSVDSNQPQQGPSNAESGQQEDRRTKLLKWKAEKELQKKIQRETKKPVFHTGVYHHKLNSPIFLHQTVPAAKSSKPPMTPRITRATAKQIAAKKNAAGKGKVPINPQPKTTKPPKASKNTKTSTDKKLLETSFAPKNHTFKAPAGLPTLPLFGPEALDEAKTESDAVPIYFSPYVVSARGKRASRKEQLHKIEGGEYAFGETQSRETSIQPAGIPDYGNEPTTSYFRTITENEVVRLRGLCQHWTNVKTDDNISEDAQLIINQAIGQTNLLIDKKIEQFKQLIFDCEHGSKERIVTCQDLQGFWDMMYMQVEDCDSRFKKLVQLQERDWEEEQPDIVKKVVPKKPAASKKIIPSKSSAVRDMIRAARRNQIESQKAGNSPATIVDKSSSTGSGESSRLSAVKFDGGFFVVESPKKTVTPKSVRKSALTQQSVFSEEAKHRRSALHLIRLSQILKPPEIKPIEVESDPTIPYINSGLTPGKNILKRTDAHETASRSKKSQNKVNFSKTQEMERNNTSWLGQSVNMSYPEERNAESEFKLNVKKKLNLSVSDSDVDETEEEQNECNTSCEQKVNFLGQKDSNDHRSTENRASANLENVDSVDTTRLTRRTCRGVLNEHNQEVLPKTSKIRSNESGTVYTKKCTETVEHRKENTQPNSLEFTKRRRSTRKSVRFTGEDCTACADVKPVYPMTPQAKKRTSKLPKTPNADGNSTENTESVTPSKQNLADLISWDSPKDEPPRVRRSLRLQHKP